MASSLKVAIESRHVHAHRARSTMHRRLFASIAGGSAEMTPARAKLGFAGFVSLAALTASLGHWQMKRREWKITTIAELRARFDVPPVPLEQTAFGGARGANASPSTSEADAVSASQELRRVALPDNAEFLHDRTFLLGPRVSPKQDAAHTNGLPPSGAAGAGIGHFVITPMVFGGRVALVNRGWVAKPARGETITIDAAERPAGGVAVVRNGETMSSYLATGFDERSNTFLAMDLPMMLRKMELLTAETAASAASSQFLEMCGAYAKLTVCSSATGGALTHSLIHAFPTPFAHTEPQHATLQRRQAVNFFAGGHMAVSPDKHALYAATWFSFTATIAVGTFLRFRKHAHLLRM